MPNFWEVRKGDILVIKNKKYKSVKIEAFGLPKAKEDTARWVFLKLRNKFYVIYMLNRGKKPSFEEIEIDPSKKQWWRNYTAVKKLKF